MEHVEIHGNASEAQRIFGIPRTIIVKRKEGVPIRAEAHEEGRERSQGMGSAAEQVLGTLFRMHRSTPWFRESATKRETSSGSVASGLKVYAPESIHQDYQSHQDR